MSVKKKLSTGRKATQKCSTAVFRNLYSKCETACAAEPRLCRRGYHTFAQAVCQPEYRLANTTVLHYAKLRAPDR